MSTCKHYLLIYEVFLLLMLLFFRICLPLGTGNFGVVNRAIWTDSTAMVSEVAVKSLSNNVSASERTKLLQEAAIMGQFCHSNVLKLYGIVLQTDLVSQ